MQRTILLGVVGVLGLLSSTVQAQVPQIINYQGRVLVGTTNFNGTGSFKFALVNSNGSTTYWSNDGTSSAGSQPTNAVSLSVANGLYSVVLGDIGYSNMTVVPASVFSNFDVRLRVWFNDGTHGSQLLTPDQRIASVGYSMQAAGVADGAITSAKIGAGAVGTVQIANGAVGALQIANGGVSATQIADGSVTGAKIGVGQVVKNVNGITDVVTLLAGSNIAITPSGNTLTLASSAGPGVWSLNGSNAYYNGGSVGIGTNNPLMALDVNGNIHVGANLANGTPKLIHFGDLNYVTIGENNADDQMELTAGKFVFNNGRIGIGTTTPAHRLSIKYVSGGPTWTSNGWTGAMDLDNSSAIAWGANSAGQRFGMGHTNGSFSMWRTAADPGTIGSPAVYDFTIIDNGRIGMGTIAPTANLHIFDPIAASERIESHGDQNAWSRMEFVTSNGQWNVGTSRDYIGDAFYVARDPSPPVFYVKPNGDTYVQGNMSCGTLTIRGGADLAEPFQMKEDVLDKGSVVVIDEEHPGRLKRSTRAYDKRVAGIVSGANGINPGIALHQEGALDGGQNVALSGRVYVQADTSNGEIEAGDMLTSSDTPGHAMKATDRARAQGAVIGKAMSPLHDKQGTVLVLVTLQ